MVFYSCGEEAKNSASKTLDAVVDCFAWSVRYKNVFYIREL